MSYVGPGSVDAQSASRRSPSASAASAPAPVRKSSSTPQPSSNGKPGWNGPSNSSAKSNWKGKSTWRSKQSGKFGPRGDAEKTPDPILFQTYFKSVGPRTYAAQLKRAGNGNHYLVFTEGKRDKVTDEVRKTSLYVFSEDFVSFFKLLKETAEYVKAHPLPAEMVEKRARFWKKQDNPAHKGSRGRSNEGR